MQEAGFVSRANGCLLALRQLHRANFDDELLTRREIWGREEVPDNVGGDPARRVLGEVRRCQPPPSTPSTGAGMLRLRPRLGRTNGPD